MVKKDNLGCLTQTVTGDFCMNINRPAKQNFVKNSWDQLLKKSRDQLKIIGISWDQLLKRWDFWDQLLGKETLLWAQSVQCDSDGYMFT